ncbi:MAG: hypothetical protein DLM64_03235 [Solirubrobacterales bacterium]|nr:MAG: hypothetical protein DLM64_03235 [Solirubrobacterales bacterium]
MPIDARRLAAMIGVPVSPDLDDLLHRLAASRLIWTCRRPQQLNRYVLVFAGEEITVWDLDRHQRFIRHHFHRADDGR